MDDVLHNADTLKFSIRTCWPRVQSDPFWLRFLHIFRRCKKQFSKDKRPSGSNKIIRRQTIKNASSLSLPSLRFLTVPVRPRDFICFSVFRTQDETLAVVFDILIKMCILFPKSRNNYTFSCRRNIQYKPFFTVLVSLVLFFAILVTLNSFSFDLWTVRFQILKIENTVNNKSFFSLIMASTIHGFYFRSCGAENVTGTWFSWQSTVNF